MTLSIAVVCEAPADQRTGCCLADRVFCESAKWIEPDLLEHLRCWRGYTTNDSHLTWTDAVKLVRRSRIRADGHFAKEPGAFDARLARRSLLLLHSCDHPPDAVILLRDTDGQIDRRRGLEQARNSQVLEVPIVIGLARTKRECWVLAGFEPQSGDEEKRLAAVRQQLGFDPTARAEQLTATHDSDTRSAKRVLDELTGDDKDREAQCWQVTGLETLKTRGKAAGLADYLGEVEKNLAPCLVQPK